MQAANIKTSIKIGIAAALSIILFEVSNLMLVYKYFKFDYYIGAVAVVFLVAGFLVSKYKSSPKFKLTKTPQTVLTNKEIEILQLIAQGKSNKEIACVNFIELSTVKTHINNIYGKLEVKNRKEAVARYQSS
jgi:DNA-binding CsgD family transcriptional regulator/general stress protein CsbA